MRLLDDSLNGLEQGYLKVTCRVCVCVSVGYTQERVYKGKIFISRGEEGSTHPNRYRDRKSYLAIGTKYA